MKTDRRRTDRSSQSTDWLRAGRFLFFAAAHHEFNRPADIISGELSQRDHVKLAVAAVELVDQHLDRQVIGE